MRLGPDPIDFATDSDAVRDRKAVDGAMYDALLKAGQSEVQAHNGIRSYRSAVLEEAAEVARESHAPAAAKVRRMAARVRAERTYPDRDLDVIGDNQ